MAEGKLIEVEQDAMRAAAKHFREQEETLQEQAVKADGVVSKTPEQVLSEVQKTTSPETPEEANKSVESEDKKGTKK